MNHPVDIRDDDLLVRATQALRETPVPEDLPTEEQIVTNAATTWAPDVQHARAWQRRIPLRAILASGAIAAALVLLAMFAWPTRHANAAGELHNIARVYNAYQGWIHISVIRDGKLNTAMHLNTVDGTFACVQFDETGRPWMYEYDVPSTGQQWVYDRSVDGIRIGSLPPATISGHVHRMSETTSFARWLELMETYVGADNFDVRKSQEESVERFDFSWRSVGGGRHNKTSVLVDPQTQLVRKITNMGSEGTIEQSYDYGEPLLSTIYDLGAPREATVTVLTDTKTTDAPQPVPTIQPATLDRKGLLQIVENTRAAINDLQVTYTFHSGKHVANLMNRIKEKVIVKGPAIYIDKQYGQRESYEFHRIIAFNGRRSTLLQQNDDIWATVQTGMGNVKQELNRQSLAFFVFNLLCPPRSDVTAANDQSLLSLLRTPSARVYDQLEMVNARACHVVEVDGLTVWLDAERSCAVMRQVYYVRGESSMVFVTENTAEVIPGLWLVTHGTKIIPARPGSPQVAGGISQIMEVENWASGRPALQVNAGVDDATFDPWNQWQNTLPPGTHFCDQDQNKDWTLPGPRGKTR